MFGIGFITFQPLILSEANRWWWIAIGNDPIGYTVWAIFFAIRLPCFYASWVGGLTMRRKNVYGTKKACNCPNGIRSGGGFIIRTALSLRWYLHTLTISGPSILVTISLAMGAGKKYQRFWMNTPVRRCALRCDLRWLRTTLLMHCNQYWWNMANLSSYVLTSGLSVLRYTSRTGQKGSESSQTLMFITMLEQPHHSL